MSAPLTTFLFETGNFLLLAGGLGWLFFRPIRQALDAKRAKAAEQARQAAEKLAEADRLRAQAAAKTAELNQEMARLRDEAIAAAQTEAETIKSAARTAADRELQAARERIAGLTQTEVQRLADAVAAGCAGLVERLMSELDAGDLDRGLTRLACRQVRAIPDKLSGPIIVESARSMNSDLRTEVAAALDGHDADFRTAPELIAGVRITTGAGLIDASGLGLATYAREAMSKQLAGRSNGSDSVLPVAQGNGHG